MASVSRNTPVDCKPSAGPEQPAGLLYCRRSRAYRIAADTGLLNEKRGNRRMSDLQYCNLYLEQPQIDRRWRVSPRNGRHCTQVP